MQLTNSYIPALRQRREELAKFQHNPTNRQALGEVEETIAALEQHPDRELGEVLQGLRRQARWLTPLRVGFPAWLALAAGATVTGIATGHYLGATVSLALGVASILPASRAETRLAQQRQQLELLEAVSQEPARPVEVAVPGPASEREEVRQLMELTLAGLPAAGPGVKAARQFLQGDLKAWRHSRGETLAEVRQNGLADDRAARKGLARSGIAAGLTLAGMALGSFGCFVAGLDPSLVAAGGSLALVAACGSALWFSHRTDQPAQTLRAAEAWSGPLQSARALRDAGRAVPGQAARTAVKVEEGYLSLNGVRIKVR